MSDLNDDVKDKVAKEVFEEEKKMKEEVVKEEFNKSLSEMSGVPKDKVDEIATETEINEVTTRAFKKGVLIVGTFVLVLVVLFAIIMKVLF
ncbi:MAG: hypothetical protein ISR65_13035 [Bacteriovoracaceae bacterium]|nr:hypothetical protein [Bacteriovoracaceae bacterium]